MINTREKNLHTWSSDKALKNPFKFFLLGLQDLRKSRELTVTLFIRDLKAQYRQSILGYLWIIIPPSFTTLTFYFLSEMEVLNIGQTSLPYPLFAFIGTMLWQLFSETMLSPINSLSSNTGILIQVNLPKDSIILAGLGSVFFNFIVRLILISPILIMWDIPFLQGIPFIVLGVISLMTLGLAVGIILCPIGLLFKDIQKIMNLVMGFAMLVTPVVYPINPDNPISVKAYQYNPVAPLISFSRDSFTTIPTDAFPVTLITSISLVILVVGWLLLRVSYSHVISRIS